MDNTYAKTVFQAITETEEFNDTIEKAASLLAKMSDEGRLIHICGLDPAASDLASGVFFRGGMPANIDPFYDPAFSFSHGAYRCALCQELSNLIPNILSYYRSINEGDPVILVSTLGRSDMVKQALEYCTEKNLKTVLISIGKAEKCEELKADYEICCRLMNDLPGVNDIVLLSILNRMMLRTVELENNKNVWNGLGLINYKDNLKKIKHYLYRIRHI